MNKKLIVVPFVITAAICAGIMYSKYDGSEALSKAYGNVDIRQSSLAFERSGRIVKLNFDEGQKVKKDEILAVLDTEALNYQIQINEANMRQAKASLDEMVRGYRTEDIKQAGANVKRLEDNLKLATVTNERYQKLYRARSVSAQEKDNAFFGISQMHDLPKGEKMAFGQRICGRDAKHQRRKPNLCGIKGVAHAKRSAA